MTATLRELRDCCAHKHQQCCADLGFRKIDAAEYDRCPFANQEQDKVESPKDAEMNLCRGLFFVDQCRDPNAVSDCGRFAYGNPRQVTLQSRKKGKTIPGCDSDHNARQVHDQGAKLSSRYKNIDEKSASDSGARERCGGHMYTLQLGSKLPEKRAKSTAYSGCQTGLSRPAQVPPSEVSPARAELALQPADSLEHLDKFVRDVVAGQPVLRLPIQVVVGPPELGQGDDTGECRGAASPDRCPRCVKCLFGPLSGLLDGLEPTSLCRAVAILLGSVQAGLQLRTASAAAACSDQKLLLRRGSPGGTRPSPPVKDPARGTVLVESARLDRGVIQLRVAIEDRIAGIDGGVRGVEGLKEGGRPDPAPWPLLRARQGRDGWKGGSCEQASSR